MRQEKSLRLNMLDFLSNIQILYQNKQITVEQKDKICVLARQSLSNDLYKEKLESELRKMKNSVLTDFKDIVFECLEFIE